MNAYDENILYFIKVLRGPSVFKHSYEYALEQLKNHVKSMEDGHKIDPVILHRIEATEQACKELEKFVERTKDLRAELIKAFREANLND